MPYFLQNVSKRATIHKLQCYVDFALFFKGTIGLEYIVVVAVVQSFELDQNLLAQLFVLLEGDLFQGNNFLGWLVNRLLDHASSTLAKNFVGNKISDSNFDTTLT